MANGSKGDKTEGVMHRERHVSCLVSPPQISLAFQTCTSEATRVLTHRLVKGIDRTKAPHHYQNRARAHGLISDRDNAKCL